MIATESSGDDFEWKQSASETLSSLGIAYIKWHDQLPTMFLKSKRHTIVVDDILYAGYVSEDLVG